MSVALCGSHAILFINKALSGGKRLMGISCTPHAFFVGVIVERVVPEYDARV
jgi:hypothetical protein